MYTLIDSRAKTAAKTIAGILAFAAFVFGMSALVATDKCATNYPQHTPCRNK
jgi:hypothetical protein